MGENGGRTTGQLLSHGPCACLAWCLMSLAHIQRAETAGLAVSDDGDGRCRKIPFLQGSYTKGYDKLETIKLEPLDSTSRRPYRSPGTIGDATGQCARRVTCVGGDDSG